MSNFTMGDSLFTGFREAIVFDVETTGIDVENDRIVSLAAVKVDFTKEGDQEFHGIYSVMNPGILIPSSFLGVRLRSMEFPMRM